MPRVLRLSDTGDAVSALHAALLEHEALPASCAYEVAEKRYGPATEAAVKAWQRRHGLTVDGMVGPRTWSTLEATDPPLTKHFDVVDFACRSGVPYPRLWIPGRLVSLAEMLEVIWTELERPIRITSPYRTPEYNRKVGGKPSSQHLEGRAADIVVVGLDAVVAHDAILMLSRAGKLPQLGGLGKYPPRTAPEPRKGFVHVDIRPQARPGKLARWEG